MNSVNKKIEKKKDYKLYIFVLQIISSLVIILVALYLRFFGGNLYNKVSNKFKNEINKTTSVDEVIEEKEKIINKKSVSNKKEKNNNKSTDKNSIAKLQVIPVNTVSENLNSLIWPVVNGTVTSNFGCREDPILNNNSFHSGIDISVNIGTNVFCAFNGVVKEINYNESYGKYIVIKHSKNFETLYAHCSKILLNKGDNVAKGDIIALSGNSGRTTGPHLHFEVIINGVKVDPLNYLTEK